MEGIHYVNKNLLDILAVALCLKNVDFRPHIPTKTTVKARISAEFIVMEDMGLTGYHIRSIIDIGIPASSAV